MQIRRIYRIEGVDAKLKPRTVYIEAEAESIARNAAIRAGLQNTGRLTSVTRDEVEEGAPVFDASKLLGLTASYPRSLRDAADSRLLRAPEWTIAIGILLGWIMILIVQGLLRSIF